LATLTDNERVHGKDPKVADNTPEEIARYDERVDEIGP
jgi:hypothetical protein